MHSTVKIVWVGSFSKGEITDKSRMLSIPFTKGEPVEVPSDLAGELLARKNDHGEPNWKKAKTGKKGADK